MRPILLFLFFVGFFAGLACRYPAPLSRQDGPQVQTAWRRTEDGWVHVDSLKLEAKPNNKHVKDVHPGILAGLQALVSIGALVLFTEFRPNCSDTSTISDESTHAN